jgi:hypothetical protein
LRSRWIRHSPRSSDRSSRSSHGGVAGDDAAPADGWWSGMLEKLCSGEDVTDDDEPSSCWTISVELALSLSLFTLARSLYQSGVLKRSRKKAFLFRVDGAGAFEVSRLVSSPLTPRSKSRRSLTKAAHFIARERERD